MEELKEENQNLSLLAGQAEHLASVLNVSSFNIKKAGTVFNL
jgi:hypothetical protein